MKQPQSIRLGAFAQTLPIVFGYGANLIATPFVVASLGLTNFGLWALTGAIAQYGVLLDFGTSRTLIRYVAFYHAQGDRKKERAIIGGCVMVVIAIGCLLMCVALILPSQLSRLIGSTDVELGRTLFISAIVVLITGLLGGMFSGASIGRGRMVASNIGVALQRASVVIGGVLALVIDPSLSSFAIASAIGGALGFLWVLIAILVDEHEIVIGLPKMVVMREIIAFSLKGQGIALSELVLFQSGKLLAGVIVGPAAAGAYELGSRLAMGARALGTGASTVLCAHLTRRYASEGIEGLRRVYPTLVQRNAAVSNFPLLLLAATSFSVVPAWLGTNKIQVVWVVIALTLAFTANVSTAPTGATAFALNQIGLFAVAGVVDCLLAVALEIPLALHAGIYGILVGMVLAVVISSLFGMTLLHRRNGIPFSDFFKPLVGPFLVGGISTIFALPVGILCYPVDRSSAILPLVCGAAIFSVLYLSLGWRFKYLPPIGSISRWRKTPDVSSGVVEGPAT